MRRLAAALRWDVRLQVRHGFYAAAAVVAAVTVAVLRWVPEEYRAWLVPAIVLFNMQINGFYFLGGLVLLEKAQGSLEALVVTPLRPGEYLASKVATLALFSLGETLAIAVAACGLRFDPLLLVAGVALVAGIFCLCGFLVVVRYDSINEYLLPSVLYTSVLTLPALDYFEIWKSRLVYLHPVQAPLVLLGAAFRTEAATYPGWELAYGLGYGALTVGVLALLSRRAFHRFVVTKEGARG